MASKFTLFKGVNHQFYFNLKAANGEKVLSGEGYQTRSSAKNGIDSVKQNATADGRYEKKTSSGNQYYFILKAANNQIIGVSEMYSSPSGRDKGIEVVKREAPGAVTEDITTP